MDAGDVDVDMAASGGAESGAAAAADASPASSPALSPTAPSSVGGDELGPAPPKHVHTNGKGRCMRCTWLQQAKRRRSVCRLEVADEQRKKRRATVRDGERNGKAKPVAVEVGNGSVASAVVARAAKRAAEVAARQAVEKAKAKAKAAGVLKAEQQRLRKLEKAVAAAAAAARERERAAAAAAKEREKAQAAAAREAAAAAASRVVGSVGPEVQQKKYCVCRGARPAPGGPMVSCLGPCGNRYHAVCLYLSKAELSANVAANEGRFLCPFCSLRAASGAPLPPPRRRRKTPARPRKGRVAPAPAPEGDAPPPAQPAPAPAVAVRRVAERTVAERTVPELAAAASPPGGSCSAAPMEL